MALSRRGPAEWRRSVSVDISGVCGGAWHTGDAGRNVARARRRGRCSGLLPQSGAEEPLVVGRSVGSGVILSDNQFLYGGGRMDTAIPLGLNHRRPVQWDRRREHDRNGAHLPRPHGALHMLRHRSSDIHRIHDSAQYRSSRDGCAEGYRADVEYTHAASLRPAADILHLCHDFARRCAGTRILLQARLLEDHMGCGSQRPGSDLLLAQSRHRNINNVCLLLSEIHQTRVNLRHRLAAHHTCGRDDGDNHLPDGVQFQSRPQFAARHYAGVCDAS